MIYILGRGKRRYPYFPAQRWTFASVFAKLPETEKRTFQKVFDLHESGITTSPPTFKTTREDADKIANTAVQSMRFRDIFTSTVCYMLASIANTNTINKPAVDYIFFDGFDFVTEPQYHHQAAGIAYWTGILEQQGTTIIGLEFEREGTERYPEGY